MGIWQVVWSAVGPVFLVIGLGAWFGRRGPLETRPFIDWVIYVGQPALIIHALLRHPLRLEAMVTTGLGNLFVLGGVALLTVLTARILRQRAGEMLLPSLFANAANIPLPLALFAFGDLGLSYQVIYMTMNSVMLYTVGVALASGRKGGGGWREVLRLPLLYATVIGLVLSQTGTTLPVWLARSVEMLGDTAIPVMLFTLGVTMARGRASGVKDVVPVVLLRTLGGGLCGLLFVLLFQPGVEVQRAVLLGAFMPSAVQTFMLSAKFGNAPGRAAAAVFFSSLFALLYIPVLMAWLVSL